MNITERRMVYASVRTPSFVFRPEQVSCLVTNASNSEFSSSEMFTAKYGILTSFKINPRQYPKPIVWAPGPNCNN